MQLIAERKEAVALQGKGIVGERLAAGCVMERQRAGKDVGRLPVIHLPYEEHQQLPAKPLPYFHVGCQRYTLAIGRGSSHFYNVDRAGRHPV